MQQRNSILCYQCTLALLFSLNKFYFDIDNSVDQLIPQTLCQNLSTDPIGSSVYWTGSEVVAMAQGFPELIVELGRFTTKLEGIFHIADLTYKVAFGSSFAPQQG